MSLTILNLRHYNTPTVEGIVQPSSNTGYQLDRLPYHKYHHRNGYRQRNSPKLVTRDRGSRDHNRRGHVRGPEELVPTTGLANTQGRGSGINSPGASFPIWSCV